MNILEAKHVLKSSGYNLLKEWTPLTPDEYVRQYSVTPEEEAEFHYEQCEDCGGDGVDELGNKYDRCNGTGKMVVYDEDPTSHQEHINNLIDNIKYNILVLRSKLNKLDPKDKDCRQAILTAMLKTVNTRLKI